jgi:LPPG:FO 2-phospho-L-lactate transferase
MSAADPKLVALSGGVGGAKLVDGLRRVYAEEELLVVANTGDDFEHLGLPISPDLDTLVYTLAGLADPERGWGRAGESWHCMEALAALGGPDWFRLGDRDLALHLWRAQRLRAGATLSAVTREFCAAVGVALEILPMTDDRVATVLDTDAGCLGFQDYFVKRRCAPQVRGIRFEGALEARPTAALAELICRDAAGAIVICPSNPYLSVDPMLAIADLRDWLTRTRAPVLAVSPIIAGEAVKGPAAKLLRELAGESSAVEVARHYAGIVDVFVLDVRDAALREPIERLGLEVLVTDTLMRTLEDRTRLAAALRRRLDAS